MIEILNSTERVALGNFEYALASLLQKGAINGYSENNFPEDIRRGMVDFWVTPRVNSNRIPFCVADGRRQPGNLETKYPKLPIIFTTEKDGSLKDLRYIEGAIQARIKWYLRDKVTIYDLIDDVVEMKESSNNSEY